MTRERGDWIPWYVDDSPGWLDLSLAARGAAEGIARKMGRRSGELHLGARGLRGLTALLRCSWEELEPALAELLGGPEPRFLVTENERLLIDPQHSERRRETSRERTAKYRARKAAEASPLPAPSPEEEIRQDKTRQEVTSHVVDVTSPNVTRVTDEPPEWWDTTCATVEMATGETFNRAAAWLRYSGHRGDKGKRITKADAQQFLVSVDAKERRQERERERVTRDLAHRRDEARAPKREPVWKPPADDAEAATPEEHRRFAAELQRRLAAGASR